VTSNGVNEELKSIKEYWEQYRYNSWRT